MFDSTVADLAVQSRDKVTKQVANTRMKKTPGGKTTLHMLHTSKLSMFGPAVDFAPLEELSTDTLINQIVENCNA